MLDVTIGSPQRHLNMTLFPLLAPEAEDLPYDLLVDALSAGTLTVGEVGQGTVPTLAAKNAGDRDVLVLDGEQLIGARQNRMTNRSILLPAHSETELPVYCMEQGRWHFSSDAMAPSAQHSPSKVRRRAREAEVRHAKAGGAAGIFALREEQGAVWSDVAETLDALGGSSDTGSLDAAYTANADRLQQWLAAFDVADAQVGLLVFAGDRALGMDMIGAPRLYARLHGRLLRGYVMDALEHASRAGGPAPTSSPQVSDASRPGGPDPTRAQRYLDAVTAAERTATPSVGRGTYRVLNGDVIGGELMDGERVAHLSAFPTEQPRGGRTTPVRDEPIVAPPSRRRNRFRD